MVCSVSTMASAIMSGIRRAAPACAASTPRSAASISCKDFRRLTNTLSEKVRVRSMCQLLADPPRGVMEQAIILFAIAASTGPVAQALVSVLSSQPTY